MGGGSWSSFDYQSRAKAAKAAGRSTFDHDDQIRRGARALAVHELLDPLQRAGGASPFAGQVMRESSISDEHPHPTSIAIVLDVTASNGAAARAVHAKLPQLFGVLQRKGYVEDPQILIAATGDANSDSVPVQFGQFESDNRIDAQVEAMYLEGGGGGQQHETYEILAYLLANHTHLDSWHQQNRKGYVFFIGDEKPYPQVKNHYGRHSLATLTGDALETDLDTRVVFDKLKEQYEPYFLFQAQGSYTADLILPPWKALLDENALVLDDPNNVCEFIAGLLAIREGGIDLDDLADDLSDAGFDRNAIASVSKTLATVGGRAAGGAIATTTDGDLDLSSDETGVDRL